jgi:methyl-accepting chemotaxis protein
LQWQLTTYIGGAVVGLMLIFLLVDYTRQRKAIIADFLEKAKQESQLLQVALNGYTEPSKQRAVLNDYCEKTRLRGDAALDITIVDANRRLIASSWQDGPDSFINTEDIEPLLSGKKDISVGRTTHKGQRAATVTLPLHPREGDQRQICGLVQCVKPMTDAEQLSRDLLANRMLVLVPTLIVTLVAVWWTVNKKIVKPLNTLFLREYALSKGDLSRWPYHDPNNEISELYDMFNRMVDRLRTHQDTVVQKEKVLEQSNTLFMARLQIRRPVGAIIKRARQIMADPSPLTKDQKRAVNVILRQAKHIKAAIMALEPTASEGNSAQDQSPQSKHVTSVA